MFERGGARVVTDAVSLEFLKGAVIEYEDSLMRSAFQVSTCTNVFLGSCRDGKLQGGPNCQHHTFQANFRLHGP